MLLDLSQEHKEHLAFLPKIDSGLGDLAMESGVLGSRFLAFSLLLLVPL
uniref:Uncharacterized protein n=1 Tax=Rhinolophus ferrumequinum TaxID=59479 RepID=A0A671DKC0_RHIFE